jgi:parallel beta-helix repeat protein
VRRCGPTNQAQCADANNGLTPQTAWATLQRAARHFNRNPDSPGEVIIVGPGVYREGDIDLQHSGSAAFPKMFLADSTGGCTSDPAGPVVLDAQLSFDVGFLVFGASDVIVSGFHVTNAREAGVQVRRGPFGERSVRVTIANNVIFNNGQDEVSRGIDVTNAGETTIFNNLIYRNTGNGIGLLSAPRSKVINNTVYGHSRFGVVIAQQPIVTQSPTPTAATPGPTPTPTPGPSDRSWLINNIIAGNATVARAFSIDVDRASSCDYVGAFNLIDAPEDRRYSAESPRDRSDIFADPGFVDADNGDFHLRADSVAIDAGSDVSNRLDLHGASVQADRRVDAGTVDLGYHFDNDTIPFFEAIPVTTQTMYVRAGGDDAEEGDNPDRALRTISAALERARAVSRIVVGPGTYRETVAVSSASPAVAPFGPSPAGPVELFADAQGRLTGDTAGRVVVDAHHAAAGINVIEHCSTVVDGFVVMNGGDDGIRLKSAHRSVVRNNTTVSNDARGINVVDTNAAQIINNLSYANIGGIQIGGNSVGSHDTVVENNTVYRNQADGILIGTGPVASTGTLVRYNIIDDNGQNGLQLDDNNRAGRSADGFCAEFNIVFQRDEATGYGPILAQHCPMCDTAVPPCAEAACRSTGEGQCALDPPNDLNETPHFVRPVAGGDGCLGGRRFWDDGFWLESPRSRAIDLAPVAARSVGLNDRTTESCSIPDRNGLDAGFHALDECFTDIPPLAGDCNADNCVTVDEMVSGVNIVLERRPMSSCPAFDVNGDAGVTVEELVAGVNDLFCCAGSSLVR